MLGSSAVLRHAAQASALSAAQEVKRIHFGRPRRADYAIGLALIWNLVTIVSFDYDISSNCLRSVIRGNERAYIMSSSCMAT